MNNQMDKPVSSINRDLVVFLRHLWEGRLVILLVTGIFVVMGFLIAFTTQVRFKAEARLLPEIRDTQGGASQLLRQFGSLGGMNLPMGQAADAIRPELYPDVLRSTPFFLYLMYHEISVETDNGVDTSDLVSYIREGDSFSLTSTLKKYTIRLPWTIAGWFRAKESEIDFDRQASSFNGEIPGMSTAEFEVSQILRERINASVDRRSGIISISAEFPDPKVAAQVAQLAVSYLTGYITQYRTEKAQKELEFIKERYSEKREEFHLAQTALARFRDANRNIVSAAVQTEEQRLQDQYNLAFNIYNNLAQQLEQARIKVQEETPVIKELEPVHIPVERSRPARSLIIIICFFLGGMLGAGVVFGRILWIDFYGQFNEKP